MKCPWSYDSMGLNPHLLIPSASNFSEISSARNECLSMAPVADCSKVGYGNSILKVQGL